MWVHASLVVVVVACYVCSCVVRAKMVNNPDPRESEGLKTVETIVKR